LSDNDEPNRSGRKPRNWPALVAALVYEVITTFDYRKTDDKYRESQDRSSRRTACATVAMAVFTAAIFALGVFQYLVLKGQLTTMQGQLDEMRIEQRPWLSAEITISDPIIYDGFGIRVPFTFKVKNPGKEPAFHADARAMIYSHGMIRQTGSLEEMHTQFCEMAGSATRLGNTGGIDYVLFPNDVAAMLDTPIFKYADVESLREPNGALSLLLTGVACIDYYDSTKQRHWTAYQFWISSKNGPVPDFSKTSTIAPDTLKITSIGSYAD
jgi:hypothetical protein